MMWSSTSEDLHDDFEGSQNEHCIFTEIFFGKDDLGKRKRSLSTEFTNFKYSKAVDTILCANSENSAITSQSSSKSIMIEGSDVKNNSADGSVSGSSPDSFDLAQGDEHHKSIKRRKFTVKETDRTEASGTENPTSFFISNRSVVVMPVGDTDSARQLVKMHLVELSNQGVCSSYYTLKRNVKVDSTADINATDVRCRLSPMDEISGKEMVIGATGGSPVSQESHETKLLVQSPSTAMLDDYEYPLNAEEGPESFDTLELNVSTGIDFKKDPRPFLQSHINRLLSASGWSIFKRKRPCRTYMETAYLSPTRRTFRDFPKVWKACGQILCAGRYHLFREDYCKEWISISQFWSDLVDAMTNIEKELEQLDLADSLALWWSVLDPFVNVVFIKRKVGCMRRGKPVKGERTLLMDSKVNNSLLALTKVEEQPADTDLLGDSLVNNGDVNLDLAFHQTEPYSTQSESLDIQRQFRIGKDEHSSEALRLPKDRLDFTLKKKQRRKSKKISELRTITLYQNDDAVCRNQLESSAVKGENFSSSKAKKSCRKWSASGSFLHKVEKNRPKSKTGPCSPNRYKNEQRTPTKCEIKDDDLLVSALLKNKDVSPGARTSTSKRTTSKSRARSKVKGKRRGCRLLPRHMAKVGESYMNAKWSLVESRTVLSWLIHAAVISVNAVIQFRNQDDGVVIKDGLVTRDGIMCKCCNIVFSVSQFKIHAGFKLSRPCLNLFTNYGKPLTLCQLQAWSGEYKTRKSKTDVVRTEEDDHNDDSCGVCGDVGELVCCDNCPSTFHQACLHAEELPEGSWYCRQCTCWICGNLVTDNDGSLHDAFKCSQCEHKYHDLCQKRKNSCDPAYADAWFCGGSCEEVYAGLHSLIGISNMIADGFCWTLLRCIQEDQKVHNPQRLALKAECNSKLVVALTIMEECFQSMVDPRTGIDMIPHVLYNWGSEFARLNFHGFYSVILEKDDVVISVASIRVHGVQVAEMPLIATCSKYRRQGMCRRLMTSIEEMLMSFKVEKLVISAIPELVSTWTEGFGFIPVSDDEKRTLSKVNLMVFPGTILLKKSLHEAKEGLTGSKALTEVVPHPDGDHLNVFVPQSLENCCTDKIDESPKNSLNLQLDDVIGFSSNGEPISGSTDQSSKQNCSKVGDAKSDKASSEDSQKQERFSKAACVESLAALGISEQSEVVCCSIQSVNAESSSARQPQQVCELNGN